MNLHPTGRACHVLAMVLRPPALDETHADCAHFRELVDGLETVVDGLAEQRGELLIVEDLERAARRDLADGRGVEAVVKITVTTLYKYTAVTQALCKYLTPNIVQMNTYNRKEKERI